eukprot:TRINITY_DN907_c0_g1_i13.p1 TRINITY_DN907_c0_g1~~TRINITY_DN907_c0_g1_i13.p1  ORF type:complete len:272 (+),score=-12.21 TRINITY_DN907_c0_g1_i13:1615-2430(+)
MMNISWHPLLMYIRAETNDTLQSPSVPLFPPSHRYTFYNIHKITPDVSLSFIGSFIRYHHPQFMSFPVLPPSSFLSPFSAQSIHQLKPLFPFTISIHFFPMIFNSYNKINTLSPQNTITPSYPVSTVPSFMDNIILPSSYLPSTCTIQPPSFPKHNHRFHISHYPHSPSPQPLSPSRFPQVYQFSLSQFFPVSPSPPITKPPLLFPFTTPTHSDSISLPSPNSCTNTYNTHIHHYCPSNHRSLKQHQLLSLTPLPFFLPLLSFNNHGCRDQ